MRPLTSSDSRPSSGGLSAGSATGTTAFRRTDLSTRRRAAIGAGVLLVALGYGSRYLPRPPEDVNAILSATVSLVLIVIVVWGMATLDTYGHRLLLGAAVILPFAMLMIAFGAVPLANLAKVLLASILGVWLAQSMATRNWILLVAVASSLADIVSVAVGPTRALLDHSPEMIGGFTVAMAWFGYPLDELYSAIGVSDFVFFALYVGAAHRFNLRESASAVAMVLSIIMVLLAALSSGALPVLPMLGLFFVAANIDLFVGHVPVAASQAAEDDASS